MKSSNKTIVMALALVALVLGGVYVTGSAELSSAPGSVLGSAGATVMSQMAASSEAGGLLLQLIISSLLGLIPASIASNKGRSFGTWWFYGMMLFIVALIHSLVISSNKPEDPALVD